MNLPIPKDMEIDDSPVVELHYYADSGSTATTKDGREWEWKDEGYSVEPGTPYIPDGEWVEL